MDTSDIRTMLGNGDIVGILDTVGVDEREDFTLLAPPIPGAVDGTVTLARVGRTIIMIEPNGEITLAVHDHGGDAAADAACFREQVDGIRAQVDAANARVQAFRDDPRAAMRAVLASLLGASEPTPDTDGMPSAVAPVPLPTLASDPPTGYYL